MAATADNLSDAQLSAMFAELLGLKFGSAKKTRSLAVLCMTPCDHPNRNNQRKKLPCCKQHRRRTGKGSTTDSDVREQQLRKWRGKCCYCKIKISSVAYEVDHIYPFSKGGYDGEMNFAPSCRDCNRSKSDKAKVVWKPKVKWGNTYRKIFSASVSVFLRDTRLLMFLKSKANQLDVRTRNVENMFCFC